MSSQSPDESSLDTAYPQPPTFELLDLDPLHTGNPASPPYQLSKNYRVPQPKHSRVPMREMPWIISNATRAKPSSSKMVIVHPKSTFLRDDTALNNVYNSSLCNNNAWKCVECLKVFYMKNRLKLHYILEHKVGYCHLCDIFLESIEEQQDHHRMIHEGKTCDFCYVHINSTELVDHHRLEHDVVSCPYCFAYIRPRSELGEHIVNTHRQKVSPDDLNAVKLFKQTGGESFKCYLCAENRRKELTGHFNIYHKIHTHVIAELFVKYKVNITLFIEGFSEYGSTKDITCEVCKENIPEVVPIEFHSIYCCHQFHCAHCSSLFPTADALNAHSALIHERHPCKLNCANMAYNSAENLTKHYLAYHKVLVCPFCDDMVPAKDEEKDVDGIGGLQRHLKLVHACLGMGTANGDARLMEIAKEEDSDIGQLTCLLCNDIIPCTSTNAIYFHFHLDHSVINPKLFTQIGGNLLKKFAEVLEENTEDTISSADTEEEEDTDHDEVVEDISDRSIPPIFNENFVECLFEFSEMNTDLETKCELCPEEFGSPLQYINHITSRHNIKIPTKYTKCDKCTFRRTRIKDPLLKHLSHYIEVVNHRDDDKQFKCNLCDNEIRLTDATEHYKTLHDSAKDLPNLKKIGYKCRLCKKAFWNIQRRDQHEIDNHFNDEQNKGRFYICTTCDELFTTSILFRKHTTICSTNTSVILYHCLKCSAVFSSIMDTTKHFQTSHKNCLRYLCLHQLCNGSFRDERTSRRHYSIVHLNKKSNRTSQEKKRKFLCRVCGVSFANKSGLGGHKHVHTTRKKMAKCMLCSEKFMTKAIRNSHMQLMHMGMNPFKCAECDKVCQSKTSLSMHRTTHLPLFQCTYCEKAFSRRDSYKEHLLIHEGPRHQCPHCPRLFTQRSNLRRHLRIHTGEKPYKCTFCDKTFSDVAACKSHISVHTRDQECKCDICGKKYSKKQKLKHHMKKHTGEDMQPCHICKKEYVGMYNLRLHLVTHENSSQAAIFLCDLCSKECKTKGSLSNHRKRCTGILKVKKEKKQKKEKIVLQPGEKRKYVKKNKKLKKSDDDDNEEYCDPGKYLPRNYELRESNVLTKLKMASENSWTEEIPSENEQSQDQAYVDDHSKDLISFFDISQMMVTTMETDENVASNLGHSIEDSDDDNISIIKLKNALSDKIYSTKATPKPFVSSKYTGPIPAQLGNFRREREIGRHLPNKDIIKSDFLTKLRSAIKSTVSANSSVDKSTGGSLDVKIESADNTKCIHTDEQIKGDVQCVDIKAEPKEEIFEEY